MIHATYKSPEKEAALGLPQLGVRFLADSNSWNVNGMLKSRTEADAEEYCDSWFLTMFSAHPSVFFSVGLFRTKFQVHCQIFYSI